MNTFKYNLDYFNTLYFWLPVFHGAETLASNNCWTVTFRCPCVEYITVMKKHIASLNRLFNTQFWTFTRTFGPFQNVHVRKVFEDRSGALGPCAFFQIKMFFRCWHCWLSLTVHTGRLLLSCKWLVWIRIHN